MFDVHDVVLHGLFDERGDLGEGLSVDVDYVVGGGEVLGRAGSHQGFDAVAEGFFFVWYFRAWRFGRLSDRFGCFIGNIIRLSDRCVVVR